MFVIELSRKQASPWATRPINFHRLPERKHLALDFDALQVSTLDDNAWNEEEVVEGGARVMSLSLFDVMEIHKFIIVNMEATLDLYMLTVFGRVVFAIVFHVILHVLLLEASLLEKE